MAGCKRGFIEEWLDGIPESEPRTVIKMQKMEPTTLHHHRPVGKSPQYPKPTDQHRTLPPRVPQDDRNPRKTISTPSNQTSSLSSVPSTPDPNPVPSPELTASTFSTIVAIDTRIHGNGNCFLIDSALLDTGASASFIRRDVADGCGLKSVACEKKTFTLADGSQAVYDRRVVFLMTMAGVQGQVNAYVSDKPRAGELLLGQPALQDFRVNIGVVGVGQTRRLQATATPDIEGLRRVRFLLPHGKIDTAGVVTDRERFLERWMAAAIGETVDAYEARISKGLTRRVYYANDSRNNKIWSEPFGTGF